MRSLSGVLEAAFGRQLLNEAGWQVDTDLSHDGCGGEGTYRLGTAALLALLPALAERQGVDQCEAAAWGARCRRDGLSATVSLRPGEAVVRLQGAGVVMDHERRRLAGVMADDLRPLRGAFSEGKVTLAQRTGARFDGVPVLERGTAHFAVTVDWQDALPAAYRLREADVARWLAAIFDDGAEVFSLVLSVRTSLFSQELAVHEVPDVVVVTGQRPLRQWFPRRELGTVMFQARNVISTMKAVTASFR
ncbi:hypothetical protein [Citrobacter braakii]|uniref:hypothetical protein n=1 Tax=Citrobacter braakii TaxID=57706 RepID=UPI00403A3F1F